MGTNSTTADARAASAEHKPPGSRRSWREWLRLALAGIWVLDGLLQYQPYMFTPDFAKSLASTAQGNPAAIAEPITWSAGIIQAHPIWTNAVFATIQLLLGIGIALRPTVRLALAGSVVWSVSVWWFGEGLGGVLTGSANPLSGAPGAVILYALLAILLWPTHDRAINGWAVAEHPVGIPAARVVWLVLWGSLAYFAILPGNQDIHGMITSMTSGLPQWLVAIDNVAAAAVSGRGLAFSIVLTVLLAVIAVGVFAPPRPRRIVLVVAIVLAALIWVVGEAVGGLFGGQGTDVNSGPLLALLALAYWPIRASTEPAVEGSAS